MFAENLVDLLAQKNIVSSDLVDGLRERIAQSPQPIPAEIFAERLVDHQVLTPSLADALLRQLRSTEKKQPPVEPMAAPTPVKPLVPVLDLRDVNDVVPAEHQPSQRTSFVGGAISPPIIHKTEEFPRSDPKTLPKRFSTRKVAENPWDSKLVLFGGTGLFALFLLGFFLYGSLFQRSADTMFGVADQAYDNGSYSQAILDYTDFVTAFPNHSQASTARIRRALARIRLIVDAKTDWSKTLETASTELKAVENEPRFFEESRAELAVLLPKIAVALAAEATDKSSRLHADRAEEALTLIDKFLPRSLQPADQLLEVRARIDRIHRGLMMLDELSETEKILEPLFKETSWKKATLDDCFAKLDALLKKYPGIDADSRFQALLQNVSENSFRTVEKISTDQLGSVRPSTEEKAEIAVPFASLFYRNHRQDVPSTEDQTIAVSAEGTVYGLRASDGTPLWRRTIDLSIPADWGTSPLFHSVPPTKQSLRPGLLLLDSRRWALVLLDGTSGDVIWNYSVGEPFRMSNLAVDDERAMVALGTESGRLLVLTLGKDVGVQGFCLPQSTAAAPLIDRENDLVYQLADRETLYVLSLADSKRNRSVFTAHRRSTVRTVPVRFGSKLLFVFQTGLQRCSLNVLSTENNIEFVQKIPIPGLVDSAPEVDGSFVALTADNGETFLFEQVDDKLNKIAEGSAGGETARRGVVRFISQVGKNVWVADWQLMRFEAQLAQARLLPKESVKRNIVTIQPLRRLGKTLFHAFRQPTLGDFGVEAVATDSVSVLWETGFSEPIVWEPHVKDGSATVYTASGKAYTLNFVDSKKKNLADGKEKSEPFLGQPTTLLPPGTFDVPLEKVLPMKDGFDAWVPSFSDKNRPIMVYDPTATDATRFRTLLLPNQPMTPPVALDGKLLVPLVDGQVALFEAKTGAPAALPFVSTISVERQPRWTPPVVIDGTKEFLIVNNRPDEKNQVVLHRVALVDAGEAKLIEKSRTALDRPLRSPIALAGRLAAMVDDRNVFLTINVDDMKQGISANLSGPCVWGPYALGDGFVFATVDSTLHFFGSDGEKFFCSSPKPIGKPFLDGDNVLFNSSDGKFWSVDRKTEKIGEVLETGVPASVGPIRVNGITFCCGRDGTVYRIEGRGTRDESLSSEARPYFLTPDTSP